MITVKTLHSLPNAFHFETVMKTLERVGATNVPQQNAAVRPLYEDLMMKFQREDTAYKQSQKNFKSDQIKALDDERDEYAECIRRVAEAWAKLPNATWSDPAKLIVQVYKDYQFRTTAARRSSATRTRFKASSKREKSRACSSFSERERSRAKLKAWSNSLTSDPSPRERGEIAARMSLDVRAVCFMGHSGFILKDIWQKK